ncbi:glycosyltransferase [Fusobacterium ulcerans]|uniref:glycosyltransferase n=1 Tax=Fusobacterium ulcerans TaxID=861 RepID=UPI001D0AB334|nr:glycosyltransferase [Fusobacterium ulcerans]MCB8566264.1 glycosyltransferase [Fusobacterium ulcerans]MCB8650256.1 glycosyltransferase [Fusobacterium ulcerans]
MKILHVVESFFGGVYDFIKDFTGITSEYQHTIIYGKREGLKDNFKNDFKENIDFILWKNAKREISLKNDLLALKELLNLLKKEKFDAIHLHSSKAGFLGRVVARVCNHQNKVIYTTHGISFLRKDISNRKLQIYIFLEKIGSLCGGKTIACSKSEAEFIQSKRIKCSYINNGIKLGNKESGVPKKENEKLKIVTVGRITIQKNPELFNKIAENFIKNKNIEFIWIGDGELKEQLSSKNIKITGWLSQKEVQQQLIEADVYLSTASWEGLSLAVLQAMENNLPLLLSACVGNIDLVAEDYNGFLFKTQEQVIKKINFLLKDKGKTKELGKNSYLLLKKEFDIQNMVKRYKILYKQLGER